MPESAPRMLVIAGPNGAGKTTLAPRLLRDTFGLMEYVNADPIALGLSAFRPETVAFRAGRVMLARLHELVEKRVSFAFESTLATRSYAPWIRRAREQGYEFHLLFLWLPSPELAVERVRERVRLGGHDVAEQVIRRRYDRGPRNFFAFYLALAETWVVYDNSGSGMPAVIAAGSRKAGITIEQPDLWRAFSKAGTWPKRSS